MAFRPEHELHQRRRGRNWGLGLVLLVFASLVYGLTVVKSLEKYAPPAAGSQTEAGQ